MNPTIQHAADLFGLTPAAILSDDRSTHVVGARQAVMYVLREQGLSEAAAARAVGRRDHTTARYAFVQVKNRMRMNPRYAAAVRELLAPPKESRIKVAARALLGGAVPFGRQATVPTALLEALREAMEADDGS